MKKNYNIFSLIFLAHQQEIELNQITVGLTNKLYKLQVLQHEQATEKEKNTNEEKKVALIRVYGANTENIIDRERETRNLVALATAGLVSPLYGRFKNGICYGYVEGHPYSVSGNFFSENYKSCFPISHLYFYFSDVKHEEKFLLVADRMAQFHEAKIPGDRSPTLFKTLRRWLNEIPESFEDPIMHDRFRKQFSIEKGNSFFPLMARPLT